MGIIIIDGFNVEHAGPIDTRIIATAASDRLAMGMTSIGSPYSWVYDGLKVFQLSDRTNWIWNSGLGTWSSDNIGNVTATSSHIPYVPYWTSSSILGSSPIIITQSTNVGMQNYLYLGGSQSLPYDLVLGASNDNWFTIASSNNFNGIQIRNNTNLSDKINSGGQITHKFYGNTSNSILLLSNSADFFEINLGTMSLISTDLDLNIQAGTISSVGKNISIKSGYGVTTPGDIILTTSTNLSNGSGGNIKLMPGGSGTPTSSTARYISAEGPFKKKYSDYSNISPISINNSNINIDDSKEVVIINNIGSSNISVNLPDLTSNNNGMQGRNLHIQCTTFSSAATLTPVGGQNIYYNGSFISSINLYNGYSIKLTSLNNNWYVIDINFPDESWKTVGYGGFMQNGQPVSALGSGMTYSGSLTPLQIRMTGRGKLAIRGNIIFTSTPSSPKLICTLPLGYRINGGNLYMSLSVIGGSPTFTNQSYGQLTPNGNLTIQISGTWSTSYAMQFPEQEISLF